MIVVVGCKCVFGKVMDVECECYVFFFEGRWGDFEYVGFLWCVDKLVELVVVVCMVVV